MILTLTSALVFTFPLLPLRNQEVPDYASYRRQVSDNLKSHIISPWFPRSADHKSGGFQESFDNTWNSSGDPTIRSIVYQSRMTWFAANVHLAKLKLDDNRPNSDYVTLGLSCLKDQMWDKKHGGFFWQVKAVTKTHSDPVVLEKHAYGNSFGIYASASAYRASKDLSALQLAMDGFQWLDSHAHDNANGGYFEFLTQTGTPIHTSPKYPRDFIGTKTGFKSMNTHIHLLEAFSELYLASHDSRVKSRLMEVFLVVRDKIYTNPGCLNMFFNADWKPIPDYDSFGHDIETAFLLVEAAHVLGKQNDMKTTAAAKHLVDHALDYGYDPKNGGFYDSGPTFGPPSKLEKVWWTQAEGLNALLLMHLTYRSQTRKYWDEFVKTWNFVKKYQVDQKNGGWYSTVSTELTPEISQNKSDQWKDPYHQGRAMLNIMEMLQTLEDQPRGK